MPKAKNQIFKKDGSFTKRFEDLMTRQIVLWNILNKCNRFGELEYDVIYTLTRRLKNLSRWSREDLETAITLLDGKMCGGWRIRVENRIVYLE